MGDVSLLLYCGAAAPAGRTSSGLHLARSLVDLGIARSAPEEPGFLLLTDPPAQPTLTGQLSAHAPGDFARLLRHVERLRKRAAKRALPGSLDYILIAPDIAARPAVLETILAALRAAAPQARIEIASLTRGGIERRRRDYLRACTRADLVIGGAGFPALERAGAGLAQILIPDGPAEARLAAELDRTGAAMKLNPGDDIAAAIERAAADLNHMPAMIRLMGQAALDLAHTLDPDEALAAIAALAGLQLEKPSAMSVLRGSA